MSAAESFTAEMLAELRTLTAETKAMRAELAALRKQNATAGKVLISRADAAKRLGCRRERIAALIASGDLPLVRDGGRDKINPVDLERLVESGRLAPRRRGRPRKVHAPIDDGPITWKPT